MNDNPEISTSTTEQLIPSIIISTGSATAENGGVMTSGETLPTEEIQASVSSNNNELSFIQAIMGGQTTEQQQQQLPPCSMPQNNSNSSQFQIQASVSSNNNNDLPNLPFIQAILSGQTTEQQQPPPCSLPQNNSNSNQFQIQASVSSNNNDVPFIQTLGGQTMEQQQLPPQNNSNSGQFQIQAQHQCSFMQYSAPPPYIPFQQNQYQRSFMQYSAPPPAPPPYMPLPQNQYQRSFMQYSAPTPYMPLQQSQYQRSFMQYSAPAPPSYMQFQQNQYQQPLPPNLVPCPQTMVQHGPTGYVNNSPPDATAPNPHSLRDGMGNMQRLPSCGAMRGNIKAPSKVVTATSTSETSSLAKGVPQPNYTASSNLPGGLEILWREISGECQKLFTPQDIPDTARIRGYFTVYELLILKRTLESRFLGHDIKPLPCPSDASTGHLKKRNKRKQTDGENTPKKKADVQNTDQQ